MIVGTFTFYNETELLIHQMETLLCFCDKVVMQGDNPTPSALAIAKAFERKDKVILTVNKKKDNFAERDEWGDRGRLLNYCKELKADYCFHCDVDEIVSMDSIPNIIQLKNNLSWYVYSFPRYDLWGNVYNYRIPYNTTEHAGKELNQYLSPYYTDFIFPVIEHCSFPKKTIPNFHSPRVPNYYNPAVYIQHIIKMKMNNIKIIHYGYYSEDKIKEKENFYNTNPNACQNVWGKDMQVSTEEFKQNWGIGYLERKNNEYNS